MPLPDEVRARTAARHALPPLPDHAERRRIRIDAGVSLERLAAELGVSATAVQAWETGAYEPRPGRHAAYARLLAELDAATRAPRPEDGADR